MPRLIGSSRSPVTRDSCGFPRSTRQFDATGGCESTSRLDDATERKDPNVHFARVMGDGLRSGPRDPVGGEQGLVQLARSSPTGAGRGVVDAPLVQPAPRPGIQDVALDQEVFQRAGFRPAKACPSARRAGDSRLGQDRAIRVPTRRRSRRGIPKIREGPSASGRGGTGADTTIAPASPRPRSPRRG